MDENIRGNILEEEPVVFADHTKIDGTAVASTERVALLILGMHRSGTSALARVLSLAGATLPQQVLGTGEGNETGHWEPRRIALLNDELMRSLNHSWFDWRGLDLTSLPFQARRDFYQDIRTILREEYGEATLVVLKEPRTCRMAEVYINALQDIGFSPLPIIIFRNPLEVVASLMARSGWPENRAPVDAALLWLVHVLDAEHATRGTNRIFWPYEALFDDWREFLLLLQSGHNVNLPVASDVLSYQIEMFLDTKKRHQRRQSSDLSDDPVTMGWIRETYDALLQLKVNPNSDHATRTLDRIRSILQSSMPLLEQSLKERDAVFSLLTNSRTAASDAEARNLEQERRLNEARAATEALSEAHRQERAAHEDEIQAMLQSRSWKMTAPFRDLRRTAGKLIDRVNVARAAVDARGGVAQTARATFGMLRREGFRAARTRLALEGSATLLPPRYEHSHDLRDDFVNSTLQSRRTTLLSSWHEGLHNAIWDNTPVFDGPTISLSLVTFNSARWLPRFFSTLRAQGFPTRRLNVIFVDNGSTDDTVSLIEAERVARETEYASFQIHHRPNLGFGTGHDHAIRSSKDEFVLVANVDIEFHADTISGLWRAATSDDEDVASWEVRQCPYEHPKYYDPVTLETAWSSHACIMLRRRAYEEVGGYEQAIFMYGEDVELSYRLRGQGWRLRYLPQITVSHLIDFDDRSSRPNQLANSLAANILLRHRYSDETKASESEGRLKLLKQGETETSRRAALASATAMINTHRTHFANTRRPTVDAAFPFRNFDYDMCRYGHDVPLTTSDIDAAQPLVSIVTRTHGDKLAFLSEAMSSVMNQSYHNIEHIIVEDRTDFAETLVNRARERYGRNIRYIKSDGSGRSRAGNYGLAHARGEYLMFLDNDDLLFADHVDLLARELVLREDITAAYALAWEVRTSFMGDGSYKEVSHAIPVNQLIDFKASRLRDINFIPIQSILFRRSLYDLEGGFDEELDLLEDWNLWSRYARHGNFGLVKKITSTFRTPSNEAVRKKRQHELDEVYQSVRKKNTAYSDANADLAE